MTPLDRAWVNCLRMWKWIIDNLPDGFSKASDDCKDYIIDHLKHDWLKDNKFKKRISQDCFLCEYDNKHKGNCNSCPALLAHPERAFDCTNLDYNYTYDPLLFYKELIRRNARRKEG